MTTKKKRIIKPAHLTSRNTKKGVEMSWRRPSWGWFCLYLLLFSVSFSLFRFSSPGEGYLISAEHWWVQVLSLCGITTGLWGATSALVNRHRVVVNKHQLIRVTRPISLFNRYVAYDRSQIHSFYLDERQGIIFVDYQVLVLMSNKRAEPLFLTEDMTIAWYLQQALCGLLRSETHGRIDYLLRRRECPAKQGGVNV